MKAEGERNTGTAGRDAAAQSRQTGGKRGKPAEAAAETAPERPRTGKAGWWQLREIPNPRRRRPSWNGPRRRGRLIPEPVLAWLDTNPQRH